MRYIATILLLFIYGVVSAQADTQDILKAASDLHQALLKKDSVVLKKLLHENLVYGHSNGWLETKKEMIDDLFNGTIEYLKIEPSEERVVINGNTACVRATLNIDAIMGGKTLPFKLHGLQVWVKEKKNWQLLSRQSVQLK